MTVILNCLPIFFSGNNYLVYVFLLLFTFGCVFKLIGGGWKRYVHEKR